MLGDGITSLQESRPIGLEKLESLLGWYPDERETDEGTFEIGLVLAGAVSAGAYTAGVLDFMFEALDEWYRLRAADQHLPNHNVVVRVISGASAGGMNGAIIAAASRYDFPPATLAMPEHPEARARNPFFNAWVTGIDIHKLLDVSDIKKGFPLRSLLNSESLDELALGIVGMEGSSHADRITRAWLADPFKLLLTVTNLRGVPYRVQFSSQVQFDHEMVMHRDHVGFLVPVLKDPGRDLPPDLVPLGLANRAQDPAWQTLALTALATGAYPMALAPRHLSRPGSDYDYRFVFTHAPQNASKKIVHLPPQIDQCKAYAFDAIDGGTMNNEPFDLAHIELAGREGRNKRQGKAASRAIIMIDPFAEPLQNATKSVSSLPDVVKALARAFKSQTRFHGIDLTLAEAGDVYSRFLIAPRRAERKGASAIASAGMGGFLGFFCEAYREHDYMLGRRNCQRFLREWFVLPSEQTTADECDDKSNPLFRGWSQDALDDPRFRSKSKSRPAHRQIIPLVGTASEEQGLPDWPKNKFNDYDRVRKGIKKRINKLSDKAVRDFVDAFYSGSSTFVRLRRPIIRLGAVVVVRVFGLRNKFRKMIEEELHKARKEIDE